MTTLAAVVIRDILANRPAAAIAGRLFYDTTNSQLQRDNGSSWDAIEGVGGATDHGALTGLADDDHPQYVRESEFDVAGDLLIGTGSDTLARLARGADGQVFRSTATTVAWEDDFYIISYVMDGGGAAISTGVKPPIEVPMAGAIVASRTLLDQSATFTMDWWKDTYANYPPLDADSITASAQPGTAAAIKDEDTTLTGWTTTVAAGDILIPNVDANDTAEWAVCILKVKKT